MMRRTLLALLAVAVLAHADAADPIPTTTTTSPSTTIATDTTTTTTWSTSTTLAAATVTPAALATARQSSVRLADDDQCAWSDGATATQPQRAAMLLNAVTTLMPEGLLYIELGGVKACAQYRNVSQSGLLALNGRLRTDYRRKGALWQINRGCRDYGFARDEGGRVRTCSTDDDAAARACFASPYMTSELLEWADMRKEDGRCVKGADYAIVVPGKEDPVAKMAGLLDFKAPLPPLTAAQEAAIDDLLATHHAVDDGRCGVDGATPPARGLVQAKLVALIATATTETQKHLFQLDAFPTVLDPRYSLQDVCDLSRLEGVAMHRWGDAEKARRWGPTTTKDGTLLDSVIDGAMDHASLHVCATYRNTAIRLTCKKKNIMDCPLLTCAEALACARGATPGCTIPWLPAGWRTIMPAPAAM